MENTLNTESLLYQTEDGRLRVDVRLENETVWLSQKQMAELFQKDVRTISEYIQNVFAERELRPEAVIRKFRITASAKEAAHRLPPKVERKAPGRGTPPKSGGKKRYS